MSIKELPDSVDITFTGTDKFPKHIRNRYFFLLDVLFCTLTPLVSLILRVDTGFLFESYLRAIFIYTLVSLLIKIPVFHFFGLYRCYWLYASLEEMKSIVKAIIVAFLIVSVISLLENSIDVLSFTHLPRSIPFLDALLTLIVIGGSRLSVRALASPRRHSNGHSSSQKRVLIVGAGEAGSIIVREMHNSRMVNLDPIGFIDDNRAKQGTVIHGVPVLGSTKDIPAVVKKHRIEEVIIAMPTASGSTIRQIVKLCEEAAVSSRSVPGIYELLNGQASLSRFREVKIEDLLRREPVNIDTGRVQDMIRGKRVMVTGAGGSIGTELCLQIARFAPEELILLGHGENSLFLLASELAKVRIMMNGKSLPVRVVLGDVRDIDRMKVVFSDCRPQIIFHAAAHKHVPLTESNPEEAVTTNVLGTRNVVNLSKEFGIERFVLISTDKAVNPVNILGMTKRVAELLVREVAEETGLPYVSVRFGNVLGSRGSVVPTFRRQIAEGGPVTVTHPEMCRFFMTIPEAVQLVLQSATLGKQGEVFVLDMGDPVKIVDLAKDMIELSGYQLGKDVDITYTGLRPGEKLYEELFTQDELPERTKHNKIFVASTSCSIPDDVLDQETDALLEFARKGDRELLREKLHTIINYAGENEITDWNFPNIN